MPVINGVYLKDFTALPSSVTDANIIPIAITGDQVAYRTTVGGIVTDARVTGKILTGLSVTGGAIAATDTILAAFGKVQNQINGKVSSVGLTMPSAFNVANSPITSSGTLAVTAAGVASQYIRGDGALADFPTNGGGGSSVAYYLNGSVNQGTFVGNTYYEMNKTPVIGAGTDFTINADGYIAQFITDANDPASLLIPGGNWNVEMYFSASSNGGTPSFYVEVYKYNGTTFTLLGTNSATPEGITNGTAIDIYYTSVGIPETVLTITDRLAIRVYVTHSGRTITLHTEDNHLSEIVTTFSNGLNTLNGLTKQAQYFAVGSTGTDFAISSSVDTHTFNIPSASASNRGLITTGAQTIAGDKTLTGQIVLKEASSSADYTKGLKFPDNPFGGGADNSGLRLYPTSGENLTLELYVGNDSGSDKINFATGVGGTPNNDDVTINGNKIWNLGNLPTPQSTITLTTTGTSGAATFIANTLNIPNYADGGVLSLSAIGGTANANGATITGTVLNLEPASASFGGVVTTGTQTFAGAKTFSSQLTLSSTISNGTYTYTLPSATGTLALTSALSGYLPLTGGTLTGALSGTSATFNGVVTSSVASGTGTFKINNSSVSKAWSFYPTTNGSQTDITLYEEGTGTNVMTFKSGGNVGIGTASPDRPLDIYSAATVGIARVRANNVNGGALTIQNDENAQSISIYAAGSTAFSIGGWAGNSVLESGTGIVYSAYNGNHIFQSGVSGRTERMRITSGGNVGIGTTSPVGLLNIYGGDANAAAIFTIQSSSGGSGNSGIYFRPYQTPAQASSNPAQAAILTADDNYSASIQFWTKTQGAVGNALVERMRIFSGGNVFIGSSATDNGNKFQVVGSGNVASFNDTTSGDITITLLANGTFRGGLGADANYALKINGTGGTVAVINTSTGAYTATSDVNKKKDFEKSQIGLNEVLGLKPTLYRMKTEANDTDKHLGFVAQEVKEFIPQAYQENNGFIGLDYNPIVAALVKAIQELKAEIDILKNN
jgi:hypothetical protein